MALTARRSAGFTLIEVMIVVVIIGILSSIAYPSYQDYVKQARRADAQASLMELAQFMERHYTSNGGYLKEGRSGGAPTLPFTSSPKNSSSAAYTLSLAQGITAQTYSLQAVPTGMMSGDSCGTLTVDHRGKKGTLTVDHRGKKGSAGDMAKCWKR